MNMMSTLAAAGMVLALTLPAPAQDLLTGADDATILAIAKTIGTAALTTQSNGDPLINGSIDGVGYQIYFRNCTAGAACEDLNFYAGFSTSPTLDKINEWNRDKRFSRAYLDDAGDAAVEMDLDLVQGVTSGYLTSQFALWPQIVSQFRTHIGY